MPVAIDTSILIHAERLGDFDVFLPEDEAGPYYVPAHAAAEFLAGAQPPTKPGFIRRALRLYHARIRPLVRPFGEEEAASLAELSAELRRTGRTMKWFDAAIAASALAHGDKVLTLDADYDRLKDSLTILKPGSENPAGEDPP